MMTTQVITDIVTQPVTIVPKGKASMVKNLIAQYRQLGEEEQKIQQSRAAVRELLVKMFEEGTSEMVIGNSRVATFTKETRVLLNTDLIKNNFPYEKFSDFYVESEAKVFRLTREAKVLS